MRRCCKVVALLLLLLVGLAGCGSDQSTTVLGVPEQQEVQVVDLVVISTNQILVGTETMSVSAATNFLSAHSDTVDAAVLHRSTSGGLSGEHSAAVISRVLSVGIPVLMVEQSGDERLREESTSDNIRSITIRKDQVAAFLRLKTDRRTLRDLPTSPALETTLEQDANTGAYELQKVELGLFGRQVWLVHEEDGSGEDPGSVGIRIKKSF